VRCKAAPESGRGTLRHNPRRARDPQERSTRDARPANGPVFPRRRTAAGALFILTEKRRAALSFRRHAARPGQAAFQHGRTEASRLSRQSR